MAAARNAALACLAAGAAAGTHALLAAGASQPVAWALCSAAAWLGVATVTASTTTHRHRPGDRRRELAWGLASAAALALLAAHDRGFHGWANVRRVCLYNKLFVHVHVLLFFS
jgi:small-conductance mechanosensitive channel